MEQQIVDSGTENTKIVWDGTRFGVVHLNKFTGTPKVIILSPKEMMLVIQFCTPILEEELGAGRV